MTDHKAVMEQALESLHTALYEAVDFPPTAIDQIEAAIINLEQAIAQPVPPTEPVAYAVYWGIGEMKKNSVHFERKTAEDMAAQIKSITEVRPLFAIAQPIQTAIDIDCPNCDGSKFCTRKECAEVKQPKETK